ncbi:hypothetical protein ESCO_003882 [Escovopsis weberi]|uniref:Uncharacterized protein n=1 Tax=Escovopsis weberi TaxID=150374 RepID=A0A0M8N860_ESCWE|nr:hypothetical protein ESCO_003882 [Escovopsis weberi]
MASRLVSMAVLLALASGVVSQGQGQGPQVLRFSCASFPIGNGGVHETAIDGPSSIVDGNLVSSIGDACGSICPGATFQANTVTSDIPGFTAALIGLSSATSPPGDMEACLAQGLAQVLALLGASLENEGQSSICTGINQIGAPISPTGAALSTSNTPNLGDSLALESGLTLLVSAVVHKGPAPGFGFGALSGLIGDMSSTLAQEVDSRGVLQHVSRNLLDVAFYAIYNAQLGQGTGGLTQNDWRVLLGSAATILVFNQASEVTITFQDPNGAPVLFLTVGGADI